MSYNGSGTFTINSTGQPVVAGTVITASAFNALTTDLATGLTTAITKDGQTTTTARITFAQGLTSSLVTDSSSVSTGSIITDGGVGIAKNLYVGGTLNVTGSTSLTNPVINNIKMGYTTTATAAGTTTLTISSNYRQFFTGTLAQTIVLPVTSTLVTGMAYEIENNSTGTLTVNSSGGNLVGTIPAGVCAHAVCIGTTLTTAADWDWDYISTTTITGTGANVLGTSPTITTPTISSLSSASATALTLQSAGTTAVTIDTSQNATFSGSAYVNNAKEVRVYNSANTRYGSLFTDANGTNLTSFTTSGEPLFLNSPTGYMTMSTNGSERMRIDSSGNLLVGTTTSYSSEKVTINQSTSSLGLSVRSGSSTLGNYESSDQKHNAYWTFGRDNASTGNFVFASGGTLRGSISSSTGTYTASSDLRLKKNITNISYGLNEVMAMRPVTYLMNEEADTAKKHLGFIAQELKELVDESVDDLIDPDTQFYMLDKGGLVPVLVKAIQELKQINDTQAETINALTARIVAIESRGTV